jgi:hypothetical protein
MISNPEYPEAQITNSTKRNFIIQKQDITSDMAPRNPFAHDSAKKNWSGNANAIRCPVHSLVTGVSRELRGGPTTVHRVQVPHL